MNEYKPIQPTRDTEQKEDHKLAKKIKNFIYDPSEVIGSGFSSKVFKGINENNNQQVAIKVIELAKIQNEVEKYLLNNEINALRALNHKNILRTIDILMTKNNVYIVTEFCEFGDLQNMIKNNKRLQQRDALNIIKDIVQGYIAVEQRNIIHRDLKTANVFLTKSGAKIADFGFCEFEGQKKPQIAYNVGSPAYMSPQSYKQNKYSSKSDIWGIGIILCEMLLGETPQKNLTYTQMSNNLMNGKINFTKNEDIRQILISCFKKDLRERTDSRSLLNKVIMALEKFPSNLQEPNYQRNQQVQNKNQKIIRKTPNQNLHINSPLKQDFGGLKFSTDQKKLATMSPTKINSGIKNQFDEHSRQFSMAQPKSVDQGSSNKFSAKKQLISNDGNIPSFSPNKIVNINQLKKMKSSISMLQFIFRLFKYICDIPLPIFSFLKLLLFRHRSFVDQVFQSIVQENRNQLGNHQLFKEFQFLKKMFDSTFLEREPKFNLEGSNYQLINNIMNKLANIAFVEAQSVTYYKQLVRRSCEDLLAQIDENKSNAFALWDYLMVEYEILTLYGEGFTDQVIATQKVYLESILKDQPKSISKIHIDLLRMKHKYLFEGKIEFSEGQARGNIAYPQNMQVKHLLH